MPRKIHVFGGSTIFCKEVPDDYTIPSMLQEELLRSGLKYSVENLGGISLTDFQCYARLQDTKVSPGDIIVFYGGFNDGYSPIYSGIRFGPMPNAESLASMHNLPFLTRQMFLLYENYKNRLAIVRFLFSNMYQRITSQTHNTGSDKAI